MRVGLIDLVLNDRLVGSWRRRACVDARGVVLEIGFGSGRNLDFFGDEVSEVFAVDPSDKAWARARDRISAFGRTVTRVGSSAETLPLPDDSVDEVVSTWTMCSIPDLERALEEAQRVLRPGGALHFVEHSLDPSPRVASLQRAIQPAWGRISGGCHLDRDLPRILEEHGWVIDTLHARYAAPRPVGWFVSGRARPVG